MNEAYSFCTSCGQKLIPYARVRVVLPQKTVRAGAAIQISFPGMLRPARLSLLPGLTTGQTLHLDNALFKAPEGSRSGTLDIILIVKSEAVEKSNPEEMPAKHFSKQKQKKTGFWPHMAALLSLLPVTVLFSLILFYFTARETLRAAGLSFVLLLGAVSIILLIVLSLSTRSAAVSPRRTSLVIIFSLTAALLLRYLPPRLGIDLSNAAARIRESVFSAAGLGTSEKIQQNDTANNASGSVVPSLEATSPVKNLTRRYFLNRLNEKELANFSALYKAVMSFSSSCLFPEAIDKDGVDLLCSLLLQECPEIMQVDFSTYYYTVSGIGNKIISMEIPYAMTQTEYEAKRSVCETVVGSVSSRLNGLTAVEQVKYVYDYLVGHCSYSVSAPDAGNAYGALIGGNAKCDGISKAAKWILEEAGQTVVVLSGKSPQASVGHAWNAVLLDGVFYHVDITNDTEQDGDCLYPAFLVPEAALTGLYPYESVFAARFQLPSAADYSKSYHFTNGNYIEKNGNAEQLLINKVNALQNKKEGTVTLQFEDAGEYNAFLSSVDSTLTELYHSVLNAGGNYKYRTLPDFQLISITLYIRS